MISDYLRLNKNIFNQELRVPLLHLLARPWISGFDPNMISEKQEKWLCFQIFQGSQQFKPNIMIYH